MKGKVRSAQCTPCRTEVAPTDRQATPTHHSSSSWWVAGSQLAGSRRRVGDSVCRSKYVPALDCTQISSKYTIKLGTVCEASRSADILTKFTCFKPGRRFGPAAELGTLLG